MLDAYTIGVPANGIADPSQMVPLLNCVDNRLLGFFGNSMILPFRIPQSVTDAINQQQQVPAGVDEQTTSMPAFDPVQIKQCDRWRINSRASFRPSRLSPCRRRACWARLCSALVHRREKLDLTWFWNWQGQPVGFSVA